MRTHTHTNTHTDIVQQSPSQLSSKIRDYGNSKALVLCCGMIWEWLGQGFPCCLLFCRAPCHLGTSGLYIPSICNVSNNLECGYCRCERDSPGELAHCSSVSERGGDRGKRKENVRREGQVFSLKSELGNLQGDSDLLHHNDAHSLYFFLPF